MELKRLSNQELDRNFRIYVHKEREILKDILLFTAEVDRRRMYLDFGRESLFEYMTKDLKYANGCAQRRIDAARLSHDVPGLIETIESGEMNLSKISLVQTAVRQVIELSQMHVSREMKNEVVNELIGKSIKESQVIVAQSFGIELKQATKIQHQANESVRLEITLSKEQWDKMEEMRALLSHSCPSGDWSQVFEYLADKVIQQKNKISQRNKVAGSNASQKIIHNNRSAIPTAILRALQKKQDCCQFKSKHTGQKRQSKWQLQTDHIKPIWAGGDNSLENLQRLCGKHNRYRYEQQTGLQRR